MEVKKRSPVGAAQVAPAHDAVIAGAGGSQSLQASDEVISEAAYLARLGRSIQQMRTGDVQPVREGLDELRRELAADEAENCLD